MPFAVKKCDFLNWNKESFENLEMSMPIFMKDQEDRLQHFCQCFVLWSPSSLEY